MADVFLSYARPDSDTARLFARAFEASNFSVWWDDALKSGEVFDESIERALREAKAVVVLWSPHSVASRWVRAEATLADRNKTLVPVMIEACQRPIIFELNHTEDFSQWRGSVEDRAWKNLVADVRRLVDEQAAPRAAIAEEAPAARESPRHDTPSKPGVAILPFVNMSGDPEQEYFSDGVTEDIITDLAHVSALTVASRNATFAYKGKTVAPSQLARSLKVSHVLEGSVRKSGNRVRITAQLLEASTDSQVWAERFDRTLEDIFAIQDEISKAIVSALRVRLLPAEKDALEQRSTKNAEAYELFCIARCFQRKGSERLKPVIVRICRRAVELDPGFANGWALLAIAESEIAQRGIEGYSVESARASAERAIAADPTAAEGYAALAEALLRASLIYDDAVTGPLAKAFEIDPDCYEAHLVAGTIGIARRDYERAIRHYERAIEIDPEAYWPAGMVSQAYEAIGDAAAAAAAHRRSLAQCERILDDEPDHGAAMGFLVTSLASLGLGDRARDWTRRALLFDPDNARLRYNLACAMATLDDADLAVALMDPLVDKLGPGALRWIRSDNSLDGIRQHPKFVALSERIERRLAGMSDR